MSIKTKFAALALATLAVTGGIAASTQQAQAKGPGLGFAVGAGLVGAAVVGSAIAATAAPAYAYGPRAWRCSWTPRYNAIGMYVGKVKTCGYYYY